MGVCRPGFPRVHLATGQLCRGLLSRFESLLPVAITCSLTCPGLASVSSSLRLLIPYQCLLGSPPNRLLVLKALTQDLLLGPAPRWVPLPRALPRVGPDTESLFFLFLAIFRNGADPVTHRDRRPQPGGRGQPCAPIGLLSASPWWAPRGALRPHRELGCSSEVCPEPHFHAGPWPGPLQSALSPPPPTLPLRSCVCQWDELPRPGPPGLCRQ